MFTIKSELIVLNEERNVTLTAYLHPVSREFYNIKKRPGVIVIPGGGYSMCSDREADPVALAYLKAGYQAFVLRYSVKKHAEWPNPLNDYDQAMGFIRSKAEEWGLYEDKIAVVGFSAGGHLAACAATMARNRPNSAILGYAVMIGEDVQQCLKSAPDVIGAVDGKTCPCFVFSTRTDEVVPIFNSLRMIEALAVHNISFESHFYSYGPHGFSTGDSSVLTPGTEISERASHWVSDSIGWLKEVFGDFGDGGMTEPKIRKVVAGDKEEFLSVDCTIGHLMQNERAWKVVSPILDKMKQRKEEEPDKLKAEKDRTETEMERIISKMTLRNILHYARVPQELLQKMNQELQSIPSQTEAQK